MFVAGGAVEEEEVVALEFERDVVLVGLLEEDREDTGVVEFLRVEQPLDQASFPAYTETHVGQFHVGETPGVGFSHDAEDEVRLDQLPRHPRRPVFIGVLEKVEAGLAAVAREAGVKAAHPPFVRCRIVAKADENLAHGFRVA